MLKSIAARLFAMPAVLLAGTALAADPALPDVPSEAPVETGWTFAVAPYLWMAGIEGTVQQFGLDPIEVDASFMDVLDNFDIGGMAVAEARNGKFGIAMDLQYTRISSEVATPLGVIADSVELTAETLTAFAALEYRVIDTGSATVDLMAGGRAWSVDTDVDPIGGPGDPFFFSDGDAWVDPVIGAKARMDLSDTVYLMGWGMVGGFGASSELTWDVMAALGYEYSDKVSLVGGYRALGVDYSKDDFTFDIVQQGPIFGAEFRF